MNRPGTDTGCGGAACRCGSGDAADVASVNGVALHAPGEHPDQATLRERAWAELLRQEAVRGGLLADGDPLDAKAHQVIEAMLDAATAVAVPTEAECRRYHDARPALFVQGRRVHARHILFAVTPGVDVQRLAARAEQALLELSAKNVHGARFAALARELSNCPSGAEGGDLGWLVPADCADEFARELFAQTAVGQETGLLPRLVHSRYGFHIVEVLERVEGRQPAFEEVRERIAVQLAQQARARALHQSMQLLVGRAAIEGVVLEGAGSPLVQ